jgi:uncharacterized protein YukE
MEELKQQLQQSMEQLQECNKEFVSRQLNLDNDLAALQQEFGGSTNDAYRDLVQTVKQAQQLYTQAGDAVWSAKNQLEELQSRL